VHWSFASKNQDWNNELAIDADLLVSEGMMEERNLALPSEGCGASQAATLMAPEPGACSGVHRPLAA